MHHELEIVDNDVSDVMDVTRVRHHIYHLLIKHSLGMKLYLSGHS